MKNKWKLGVGRMWRWAGWAGRAIATALLVSFLSIWTTGYIVNSYMETLLKQLDLPLETQPFALSGVWGKLWGASPVTREAQASESPEPPVSASPSSSPSAMAGPESGPASGDAIEDGRAADGSGAKEESEDADPDAPGDPDAVPAMGSGTSILDLTDQQRELLQAVMSKLSGEQLEKLSGDLEGGLTEEELAEASDMFRPILTEDEYRQVMEIFASRVTRPDAPAAVPSDPLHGMEP